MLLMSGKQMLPTQMQLWEILPICLVTVTMIVMRVMHKMLSESRQLAVTEPNISKGCLADNFLEPLEANWQAE